MFGFGSKKDEARAKSMINYLSTVFTVKHDFHPPPLGVKLKVGSVEAHVKIACENKQIRVSMIGYALGDDTSHVDSQLQRVKDAIASFTAGSAAAKWRHRVVVRSRVYNSYR